MRARRDLQWYDHRNQNLLHSQRHKVLKLLDYKCVERNGDGFLVKPIPGYNTRTYTITPIRTGAGLMVDIACNCQYFTMKHEPCSHIGAVREWLARQRGQMELINET